VFHGTQHEKQKVCSRLGGSLVAAYKAEGGLLDVFNTHEGLRKKGRTLYGPLSGQEARVSEPKRKRKTQQNPLIRAPDHGTAQNREVLHQERHRRGGAPINASFSIVLVTLKDQAHQDGNPTVCSDKDIKAQCYGRG